MADKTSLLITTTDTHGKQSTKTITNVNSEASVSNLLTFAQGLADLSDNTYDSAALVERTELVDIPFTERPKAPLTASVVNGNKTFNLPQDIFTENMYFYDGFIKLFVDDAGVIRDTTKGVYRVQLKFDTSRCGGVHVMENTGGLFFDNGITKMKYSLDYNNQSGCYAIATIEIPDDDNDWYTNDNGATYFLQKASYIAIQPTDKYTAWVLRVYIYKEGE